MRTKYSLGDVAYRIATSTDRQWEVCPDCIGQRKWFVVLPSGEELFIRCPTCESGYESLGVVYDYAAVGSVDAVVIRSIEVVDNDGLTCVRYNSAYYLGDLYDSREAAEAVLPSAIEELRIHLEESRAQSLAKKKKDRVGSMASHYLRQERQALRDLEAARRGLAREAAKER